MYLTCRYMDLKDAIDIVHLCKDVKFILIDEAQDLSKVQRAIVLTIYQTIKMLTGTPPRLLMVGDRCQAIYAFNGAAYTSMDDLQRQFSAQEFTLSTTYRCPRSHVALANKIIDEMGSQEARMVCLDTAIDGWVERECDFQHFFKPSHDGSTVKSVDDKVCYNDVAILSRTNVPLLALRAELLSRGVQCTMLGKTDLVKQILTMFNELKPLSTVDLEDKMKKYVGKKQAMFENRKLKKEVMQDIHDTVACMKWFIAQYGKSFENLCSEIKEFATDQSPSTDQKSPNSKRSVTLATVHKVKGLGFDHVYLLQPKDFPLASVMRKGSEMDRRQELNIKYVAYTRSRKGLYVLRHIDQLWDDPRLWIKSLFDPLM